MKINRLVLKKIFFSKSSIIGMAFSVMMGILLYTVGIIKVQNDLHYDFVQRTTHYMNKIEHKKENIQTILSGANLFISLMNNLNFKNFHSYYQELKKQNIVNMNALGYSIWVTPKNENLVYQKFVQNYQKQYKDNPILLKNILTTIQKNQRNHLRKSHFIVYNIEPIQKYYSIIGEEENKLKLEKELLVISNQKIYRKNHIYKLDMMINLDTFFHSIYAQEDPKNIKINYSVNTQLKDFNTNHDVYSKFYTFIFHKNKIYIMFQQDFTKTISHMEKKLMVDSFFVSLSFYILWLFLTTLLTFQNKVNIVAQKMNEELNIIAWYDNLTNLYNRAYLLKLIQSKIKSKKSKFSILFIDLDGFKKINDTLGHDAGDRVLRDYSKKLKNNFKNYNNIYLGRVGGDEFIVLVEHEEEPLLFLPSIIGKITEVTQQPFHVKNNKFKLSQSIGVCFYPEHASTEEELIRKSDLAMYHNKKDKVSNYVIYSNQLESDLLEKTEIESELITAIEKNEIYLVFQPKIKMNKQEILVSGLEVLLRWKNSKKNDISPEKFIKIAEENGFIYELTYWMVEKTCKIINNLKKEDYKLPFSINLSAQQFLNEDLAFHIIDIFLRNNISPKQVIFEITERTIMKNPDLSISIMNEFIKNGFQFSIDDFGIGYSSLSYLTKLPVSELKIDKSFIWSAQNNRNSIAVIKTIIAMGHQLRLKVIAEGIETKEQFIFLKQQNCDEYQGFYFEKPLKSEDLLIFLKNNNVERNDSLSKKIQHNALFIEKN